MTALVAHCINPFQDKMARYRQQDTIQDGNKSNSIGSRKSFSSHGSPNFQISSTGSRGNTRNGQFWTQAREGSQHFQGHEVQPVPQNVHGGYPGISIGGPSGGPVLSVDTVNLGTTAKNRWIVQNPAMEAGHRMQRLTSQGSFQSQRSRKSSFMDTAASIQMQPSNSQMSFAMTASTSDIPSGSYTLSDSALFASSPTVLDEHLYGELTYHPGQDNPHGYAIPIGPVGNGEMLPTSGGSAFDCYPSPLDEFYDSPELLPAGMDLASILGNRIASSVPGPRMTDAINVWNLHNANINHAPSPEFSHDTWQADFDSRFDTEDSLAVQPPAGSADFSLYPGSTLEGQDDYDNSTGHDDSQGHRAGSDGENTARDDPLYHNVRPSADGLYHCPWEGQDTCTHKAEKLKCNYDKFVDSHLKPYRCKVHACENARFSSTACLLRHEREAHAMHGHGEKPFLCTAEGCDRGQRGNGFPRHWNLCDHMKRVHNRSPSPSSGKPPASRTGRKRKNDSADAGSTKKGSPEAGPLDMVGKPTDFGQEYERYRQQLATAVEMLRDPADAAAIKMFKEADVKLRSMHSTWRKISHGAQRSSSG